ncbi:MAG: ATP-binding cassette domain-containing protein [Pseudomonadales bacterium]|nr:ATP-binding cassette domain-containing protein [Pseudomonadales bacterium]MBO6565676.1 ATP-binding cassette domain-containing protein [Pseudomonadales bacterium]MBO6595407.1 ATP-binding cassette domain-containing protein [Pseudomonadales bacterium]MBO6657767.1 ATP-binding cassette domain-containing protein [Pseudomonadales bacterium]MBO6821034.1 ATP-binding cassette domain-containing protein [Pseudomonadales bacterium]
MTSEVLVARGVSKSYRQGGNEVRVLRDLNLTVGSGETVAIVGVSGSGKSTLLHLLAGLDDLDDGVVEIGGQDLAKLSEGELSKVRNQRLGFIYQFHHLLPEFSAEENVAMPLMIAGKSRVAAVQEAGNLLEKVGLSHRLSHLPSELSGGERQRVAIARALVARPSIVLADEPTGNLDEDSADQIHELIISLAQNLGVAFVVVTHNHQFASRLSRVCRLAHGALDESSV